MALRMSHKGLVLVSIPLIFEISLVAILLQQVDSLELEVARESRAKQLKQLTGLLSLRCYDAGYALSQWAAFHTDEEMKKFSDALSEIRRLREKVSLLCSANKKQQRLLDYLEKTYVPALKRLNEVEAILKSDPDKIDLAEFEKLRDELEPLIDEFRDKQKKLLAEEEKVVNSSPKLQKQFRQNIRSTLIGSVAFNILLMGALLTYFWKDILGRLTIITDNTKRLVQELPLNPVLSGNDELAKLDQVFHKMSSDLTDMRERERKLFREISDNEKQVRAVMENMSVGVFTLSSNGEILNLNSSLVKLSGYKTEELQGKNLSFVLDLPDDCNAMDLLKEHAANRSFESKLKNREGQSIPVYLTLNEFSVFQSGQYLLNVIDATERYEMQRLKQEFYAMITHELRSPLMAIDMSSALMLQGVMGQLSEDLQKTTQRISSSAKRMAGLVNDLLDVEKLEAGKFELYIDDTNFATIAMRALESIEGLADRQNVVIEEKLQDLYVQADPDRSVQIVLNFLSNALKYSPRGGKITVEIRKHGSMAELSVQDEGPGISDQEQKQLFERFRQVGTLKEKKRRGTGLGLAICKMLAEQQQGGVGVESEAGKGSRFWVSLPLSRQD